jgi:thiosulfate/3-mercaptopyruvate sulfurtransferase
VKVAGVTQEKDTRAKVFIGVDELAVRLGRDPKLVLLDIRQQDGMDGLGNYLAGHIAGAVYVEFETELAGEPYGFSGRRPLPAIDVLQRDVRRWGIEDDSVVVIYDDAKGTQAARAWWVLRWAGFTNVRLLDGGLNAWTRAGYPVVRDVTLPKRTKIEITGGHMPVLDADGAAAIARSSVLVDARGAAAYRGEDGPKGGHIPGALNLPTTDNLDRETGLLLSADNLRSRFIKAGIDGSAEIGVYCGGGVAGSHQVAALASIGIKAALFPGSWSAWSSDPSRPIATGNEPG